MARLFRIEGDIGTTVVKRDITRRVSGMIPEGRASDFCQGIMELGATVCTPSSAKCTVCPVMACCQAFASGCRTTLPMKKAKPLPVESRHVVCVVRDHAGRILMEYREKGLLAGLWGLPHYESEQDVPDPETLPERLGLLSNESAKADSCEMEMNWHLEGEIGRTTHTFTHRRWYMQAWAFRFMNEDQAGVLPAGYRWVEPGDLTDMPIPEAFQKILRMSGLLRHGRIVSRLDGFQG